MNIQLPNKLYVEKPSILREQRAIGIEVGFKSLLDLRFDDLIVARWGGRDWQGKKTDEMWARMPDVFRAERIGWCDCHISRMILDKQHKTVNKPIDLSTGKRIFLENEGFAEQDDLVPHQTTRAYCENHYLKNDNEWKYERPNKWHIRVVWYDISEGDAVTGWAYPNEDIVVIDKEYTNSNNYYRMSIDTFDDMEYVNDNYNIERFEEEQTEGWNNWSRNAPKVCRYAEGCLEHNRNIQNDWGNTYKRFEKMVSKYKEKTTRYLQMLELLEYIIQNYGDINNMLIEELDVLKDKGFAWARFKSDTYQVFSDTRYGNSEYLNWQHEISLLITRAKFFNYKTNLSKNSRDNDLKLSTVKDMIEHEHHFATCIFTTDTMIANERELGHLSLDVVRYFSNNAFIDRNLRFDIEDIYA
tara:strand:+ start:1011 stop:2249 length:1239 start_codon:yes stop_codon:yes gene_type:complete